MSKTFVHSKYLIRGFFRLGWPQKALILEGFFYLLVAMILVKFVPFRWWARFLGTPSGDDLSDDVPEDMAAVRAVRRTIRQINYVFRGRFTCLMEGVAGKVMLNRRGLPNVLILGVSTQHNANHELSMLAHAWLRSGPTILLGGEVHEQYTPIAQFHSSKALPLKYPHESHPIS